MQCNFCIHFFGKLKPSKKSLSSQIYYLNVGSMTFLYL